MSMTQDDVHKHDPQNAPEAALEVPAAVDDADEAQDDFNAGFADEADDNLPASDGDGEEQDAAHAQDPPATDPGGREPEPDAPPAAMEAPQTAPLPQGEPGGRREAQEPSAPRLVEIPDALQAEFKELQRLNPEAAALAQEDSPDGEAIRSRLGNYGADLAMDRAERVLEGRQKQAVRIQEEQQAVEQHNAHFMAVLEHEVPDVMAMVKDKARMRDTAQFHTDMQAWIMGKPYAEAEPMMRTFQQGRDPHAVAALMKQFIQERKAAPRPKGPDPDGALAVPGRGAPVAPSGIGDKDDFDAGFYDDKGN